MVVPLVSASLFPLLALGVTVVVVPFLVVSVAILRGGAGMRDYLFAGLVAVLLSLVTLKAFFTLVPPAAAVVSLVVLAVPVLHLGGVRDDAGRELALFAAVYAVPTLLTLWALAVEVRAVVGR